MHNSIEPTNCIQRLTTLPTEVLPPYNWQEFQRRSAATARAVTDWRPLAAAAVLLLFVCAIAVWGRFGGGGRNVVADSGAVEDGVQTWSKGAGSTIGADRWRRGVESAADADRWRGGAGAQTADADRWRQAQADGSSARANDRDVAQGDSGSNGDRAIQAAGDSTVAANRSRAIESWLASLPREPAVVRVGTAAAVASLEDRIAQVDDLMTSMRINGTPSDRVAALQRERFRLVGSLAQVRYAEVVASTSP